MNRRIVTFGVMAVAGVSLAMAQVKINACGATFPDPIYEKWFSDYHNAHNGVQINYTANGSGGGVKGVTDGTMDFGASDMPMTDQEQAAVKGKVLHFPTVLGAVVPMYNVPGISQELKFSGPVLAGIFLGNIKKWNDKMIVADNPGVKFPNDEIMVVHRTDASGTSFIFTTSLRSVPTGRAKWEPPRP
jgi:phosphate transport system substrate-binding protein